MLGMETCQQLLKGFRERFVSRNAAGPERVTPDSGNTFEASKAIAGGVSIKVTSVCQLSLSGGLS